MRNRSAITSSTSASVSIKTRRFSFANSWTSGGISASRSSILLLERHHKSVPPRALIIQCFHSYEIDHPFKVGFLANWNLYSSRRYPQFLINSLNRFPRIRSRSVHFINETNSRNIISSHLSVHSNGLTLNPGYCTENKDRTIEDSQCSLNFNGKINVTRCVDNIDTIFFSLPC